MQHLNSGPFLSPPSLDLEDWKVAAFFTWKSILQKALLLLMSHENGRVQQHGMLPTLSSIVE